MKEGKTEPSRGTKEVVDGRRKRTVQNDQVLVVKSKTNTSGQVSLPDTKTVETALASDPVNNCTMTGSGAVSLH